MSPHFDLSALPAPGRHAVSVLRSGLGYPPLGGFGRGTIDENALLAWLSFTGLCGPYLSALKRKNISAASHSKPFLSAASSIVNGTYARNMVLFSERRRVCAALAAAGIDCMPLKGFPAIVGLHSMDLSQRQMADLDLLVRPGQVEEALRIVDSLGYGPVGWPAGDFMGDLGRHAYPRFNPALRCAIEVHRAADYAFSGMGAEVMPDFFAEARTVIVDKAPCLLPSWECWAFQWAVHVVYNDCWAGKTRDLYDMALLVAGRADADWEKLTDPCRTVYLLRPLWAGLRAVAAVFGPKPPPPWGERLAALAGQPFPMRDLPDWIMRKSLLEASLFRSLPLSFMSAMNMAAMLPCHFPRFFREFVRMFIAPEPPASGGGSASGRAAFVLTRTARVAATVADRIAGKLGRGRG